MYVFNMCLVVYKQTLKLVKERMSCVYSLSVNIINYALCSLIQLNIVNLFNLVKETMPYVYYLFK